MEQAYIRIGLLNHIGSGNLGDDATLNVVMHNIKCRLPQAQIVAFSMSPDDTTKRHGIPSYPLRTQTWSFGYKPTTTELNVKETIKTLVGRYRGVFCFLKAMYTLVIRWPRICIRELSFLWASRRIIKSLDLLLISGGGQLTEWGGPWGFPYTLFKWVLLAKSAGVKCVFLNVGAGPLNHMVSRLFVARALWAADYVSFRDDQSRMLASKIGFTRESRVYPDSAYSLEVSSHKIGLRARGCLPIVGIAPMPYCDPRVYPAEKNQVVYDEFIRKIATFASWLVSSSYGLELFGSDIGVDPLAIEDLQTALRNDHGIAASQFSPIKSLHELLTTMSTMDYVVTCRFHGVVFAHLLNKPVLAISHHPKVMTLMKDLGLSKYCVDIERFDPNLLKDTFVSLVSDATTIKSRMAERLSSYKSQLKDQFDGLFPECQRALHGDLLVKV